MENEGTSGDVGDGSSLVGRIAEMSQLQDFADLSVESGAQMVLIAGEAGIGKSTLGASFLQKLTEAGWGCHVGHCIEYADRTLPFGPIVSILRSVLLAVDLDDLDDLVRHHRFDLAGLLPELREDELPGPTLVGDVDRLFDAIAATLRESSLRRPVAIMVEDIHWADAATRDLLASLVHSLGAARILLLVTERSRSIVRGHPLHTWLAERRRFPNVHTIELAGLSRGELTEKAFNVLGHAPDAEVIEDLLERTNGNAFFAHELLLAHQTGNSELPSSLADFLTSRLERLERNEREVLRAVAVAGGTVRHRMLVAMLPDLDVGPLVRSLFDASILVVDNTEYRFGHSLLREAILRDVLPFEAEELHRLAANAIVADPQRGSSPSDLASLALHWARANDHDRSLRAAIEAANASAAVAAYKTSAEMSLEALNAWPLATDPEASGTTREALLLSAAEWLVGCHRSREALDILNDAMHGWARDLPSGQRALIIAKTSAIYHDLGQPDDTARALREASELIGDEVSTEAAQVHHRISKQAVSDGFIHPALASAERAIAIADTEGPRVVYIEALTVKALAAGIIGDLDEGIRLAREARELARAERLVSQVANTYRTEMLIIVSREGRTDACVEAARLGLEFAEKNCGPRWRDDLRRDLCLAYVEAGRLDAAQPLLEVLLNGAAYNLRRLTVLQTAALRAIYIGDLDLAESFLSEGSAISDSFKSGQETGFQFRLLAEVARRRGRPEEALVLVNQALELQLPRDNVTFTRESIVEKVRIVRTGTERKWPNAPELLDEVKALVAGATGEDRATMATNALMRLEISAIEGQVSESAVESVVRQLLEAGLRPDAVQARLLFAEQLLAQNESDLLGIQLDELLRSADDVGMRWVADRVRSMARFASITLDATADHAPEDTKPRPRRLPHHLSIREVEVLALVAEGMTNKAIGERLYVSHRTVSTHVSNLLAKLGLTNRNEAAVAYHRLGLDTIDLREPLQVD